MQKKSFCVHLIALMLPFSAASAGIIGPSSSQSPYLTPSAGGVEFSAILSVGDAVANQNGGVRYRMVGVPDGLGAYDNGDGTFTVLMNHELGGALGVTRAHGAKGAFVSQWRIRKADLKVLGGSDLIRQLVLRDPAQTALDRLCSADLAAPTAFFNRNSGKGYSEGRIYMNGEEAGPGGRAFAHLVTGREHGTSYELAALGTAPWENLLASPFEQDKTVVVGMEDGSADASRVYVYIGAKQTTGNPVELAGLANGVRYQLKIDGYPTEGSVNGSTAIPNELSARFTLVASGGTGLNRVEDGAWDTQNPKRFYFVTTDSFNGNTRLWRLSFDDIAEPTAGGRVEILVNGAASGLRMLDNIAVDDAGNVYMQEDAGNQPHLGRIWKVDTRGKLTQLAEHDAGRFIAGAAADIDGSADRQSDEESSGIIDVGSLFDGVDGYDTRVWRYFLLDVQAHYGGVALDPELVEGGQLLLMKVPR